MTVIDFVWTENHDVWIVGSAWRKVRLPVSVQRHGNSSHRRRTAVHQLFLHRRLQHVASWRGNATRQRQRIPLNLKNLETVAKEFPSEHFNWCLLLSKKFSVVPFQALRILEIFQRVWNLKESGILSNHLNFIKRKESSRISRGPIHRCQLWWDQRTPTQTYSLSKETLRES